MAFIEIQELEEGELVIDLVVDDPELKSLTNTIITIEAVGWEEPMYSWEVTWFQIMIEGKVVMEEENLEWSLTTMYHLKEFLLESPVTEWRWM